MQYDQAASARAAFEALNGRFYDGQPLSCQLTHVTDWRVAVCGTHEYAALLAC